jgi:hypothetical protein
MRFKRSKPVAKSFSCRGFATFRAERLCLSDLGLIRLRLCLRLARGVASIMMRTLPERHSLSARKAAKPQTYGFVGSRQTIHEITGKDGNKIFVLVREVSWIVAALDYLFEQNNFSIG